MKGWIRALWVVLMIPVFGAIIFLLRCWLSKKYPAKIAMVVQEEIPLPEAVQIKPAETVPAKFHPERVDDFRKIEGIGPKIASVLQAAGISTFDQLATCDPARLKEIVNAAGIRIAIPDTWPEQASLAAADEWDALKSYQSNLKGGRLT